MDVKESQVYKLLDEISDLSSLGKFKPSDDPLDKLTEIFMRAVRAMSLMELEEPETKQHGGGGVGGTKTVTVSDKCSLSVGMRQ